MTGNEDLGLSLSLSSSGNHFTTQINLMPYSSSSSTASLSLPCSSSLSRPVSRSNNISLIHTEKRPTMEPQMTTILQGIEMNKEAKRAILENELATSSSPTSTISHSNGKRVERDDSHGIDDELDASRGISDEEDGEGSRKKLRLSKDQSVILEESFKEHNTLHPKEKILLAKQLNLRPRQVEVWFQNRRARTKLKQTEVDCEFLKRCCDNLTEENRRLQKELQELKALKLSPQLYMHTAPTTLAMCQSCEGLYNSAAAAVEHRHRHRLLLHHHRLDSTK